MANADWIGGIFDSESVEEVALEKRVRIQAKSAEEIARFCIPENLSPVNRSLHLLRSGAAVQRLRALYDLPDIAKAFPDEAVKTILPRVRASAPGMTLDEAKATAASFAEICKQRSLDDAMFHQLCLRTMLTSYKETDGSSAQASWFDCILECVPFLPEKTVKKEVRDLVLHNGQHVMSSDKHIASCKLIGTISSRIGADWLKKEFLELVKSLCQDLNHEVRRMMALQMHSFCVGLGVEEAKSDAFQELLELLRDEQLNVRLAALDSLLPLFDFFDEATCCKALNPAMRLFQECRTREEVEAMVPLSKYLGKFLYNARDYLTADHHDLLVDMFCWMASHESDVTEPEQIPVQTQALTTELDDSTLDPMTQIRHNCAFNLPAVATVCGRVAFSNQCLPTLRILQFDESPVVRRTVACGLHEVVKIMSPSSKCLLQVMLGLLKDANVWVSRAMIENFPTILEVLLTDSHDDKHIIGEVSAALLLLDTMAKENRHWRLHEDLLASWMCLPRLMPEEVVYGKFAPIALGYLQENRVLPVRIAASKAIASFIIYVRRPSQRSELCEKIITSCAQSKSSRLRVLFLDICWIFAELFSRSLFKEYFFDPILALGMDPVDTIRLKVCKLLPDLKSMLTLPADRGPWQRMETTVEDMMMDERSDDNVAAVVRQTRAEMDSRNIRVQSRATADHVDPGMEKADQQKEADEQLMMAAGEEEVDGGKRLVPQCDSKKQKFSRRASGSKPPAAGPPSPAPLARRTSAPVASPGSARRPARSTSTGSMVKAGATATHSTNGTTSKGPQSGSSSNGASRDLNRQLSSSGGANLLASSTGSVRVPSSPISRLKASSLKETRKVSSLSSLDSCGRDAGSKAGDSPTSTRPGAVKLPAINAHSRAASRPRLKLPPTGATKKTPPALVLPPSFKQTGRHQSQ